MRKEIGWKYDHWPFLATPKRMNMILWRKHSILKLLLHSTEMYGPAIYFNCWTKAENSGSNFPNLGAHHFMFPSQGQVISRIITVFVDVE